MLDASQQIPHPSPIWSILCYVVCFLRLDKSNFLNVFVRAQSSNSRSRLEKMLNCSIAYIAPKAFVMFSHNSILSFQHHNFFLLYSVIFFTHIKWKKTSTKSFVVCPKRNENVMRNILHVVLRITFYHFHIVLCAHIFNLCRNMEWKFAELEMQTNLVHRRRRRRMRSREEDTENIHSSE